MEEKFMKRAHELAKKRVGFVSPNPVVGAVIVKGDQIIAEGYHMKAGDDHAEIVAIKKVMAKSGIVTMDIDPNLFKNAVLYVTLEPCSHYGRTAPCSKAIVEAGFKHVCIGIKDPFARVNGSGIKYLKDNGIKVEILSEDSPLSEEIRLINQPFLKWAKTGLPYVIMKAGMTLDGKIATVSGESKWISSEESRTAARLERSKCDAVLVGRGTVEADDPELAPHGKYTNKKLLRVIIDSKLRSDLSKKVFRDENVLVVCSSSAPDRNKKRFDDAGVVYKSFGKDSVSVKRLLKYLGSIAVQSVFVEGGSAVHGAFYDAFLKDDELLDQIHFYIAPKLFAGASLSVVGGEGVAKLKKVKDFLDMSCVKIGPDLFVRAVYNLY